MLETITRLNISESLGNLTRFQQVSQISQEPYMITGHVIIFGVLFILWFAFSFAKISNNKLCWESWINTRTLIFILIGVVLYLFVFIFPVPLYFID